MSLEEDCARLRSIRIFLQMSLSALAMARAGMSHLERENNEYVEPLS